VDDLDRHTFESWDEYIARLARLHAKVTGATQRDRLREALAQARADRLRERMREQD
jgi:hypothetical protein